MYRWSFLQLASQAEKLFQVLAGDWLERETEDYKQLSESSSLREDSYRSSDFSSPFFWVSFCFSPLTQPRPFPVFSSPFFFPPSHKPYGGGASSGVLAVTALRELGRINATLHWETVSPGKKVQIKDLGADYLPGATREQQLVTSEKSCTFGADVTEPAGRMAAFPEAGAMSTRPGLCGPPQT